MKPDEIFDRWKARRAAVELEADFTGRVMSRLPEPPPRRNSPWLAAAIVMLCLGSVAMHLMFVLLLTLAGLGKGS
jgi:hypothetical protein